MHIHKIEIVENVLPDGTEVHNVSFGLILIPAKSLGDAEEFAHGLALLFQNHTADAGEVVMCGGY